MSSGHIPFGADAVTPSPVVPRDAATVMLVRSGAEVPLEVLMLRKHTKVDFAPGAYVFPGGAVDPGDLSEEMVAHCTGRDDGEASALLGIEAGGLGFWVAAAREAFEEAGILLAYRPDGEPVTATDPALTDYLGKGRAALNCGATSFKSLLASNGLSLALDRIHYFSHWITPEGAPKRFDTRFFVGEVPEGQIACNDGSETTESLWISPGEALGRGADGSMALIIPTVKSLEAIGRFDSAASLVSHARALETVPATLPRLHVDGREVRILLPGDPGYG